MEVVMGKHNASGNWANRLQVSQYSPVATKSKSQQSFKSFGYVFKNLGDGILKTPLGTRILMGANAERTQRICDYWAVENLELEADK